METTSGISEPSLEWTLSAVPDDKNSEWFSLLLVFRPSAVLEIRVNGFRSLFSLQISCD